MKWIKPAQNRFMYLVMMIRNFLISYIITNCSGPCIMELN